MSLDFAKKIEILEAKRDALEKLLVPEMDKEEKHDIRQQIIAIGNEITLWIGLFPRPVDPTQAVLLQMLPMLASALTKNPWDSLSESTRVDMLPLISPQWGHLSFPRFCCVLQGYYTFDEVRLFPSGCEVWTVGAHIIPHSSGKSVQSLKPILKWSAADVDSCINAIPLCKEFEVAFDRLQLCFIFHATKGWVLRVMDPQLSGVITLTHAKSRDVTRFQPPNLTWGRVNGTVVKIADCVSRTALVYHSHFTAERHGHLEEVTYEADKKRTGSPPEMVQEWMKQQSKQE